MKGSNEFAAHSAELLATVGRIVVRKMFGGYGLYCDGTMFALIARDVLYLKVDDVNRGEFARVGALPFVYESKGRRTVMAYYSAPGEALESRELAAPWARSAYAAALRARASRGTEARLSRRK